MSVLRSESNKSSCHDESFGDGMKDLYLLRNNTGNNKSTTT